MEKSLREKRPKFSLLRGRKDVANNRRLSLIWINRMVHKQVQKRIADLRSEFLLKNNALKEEMMTELREQLTQLVANEAGERSIPYTKLDREQSMRSRLLEIIEENKRNTRADEEDEKKLLDPRTASPFSSENSLDVNHKLPLGEIFKVLLDILSDIETSDVTDTITRPAKSETRKVIKILLDVLSGLQSPCLHVSSEADISSLSVRSLYNLWDNERSSVAEDSSSMVKTEKKENQADSLDDFIFSNINQLIVDSEGEGSLRNPPHANPSCIIKELICEAEKTQVETMKEEGVSLIERQWKEWMDKQEMGGNNTKVELPVVKRKTETQEEAAHLALPAPNNPTKQHVEGGHNLMKMKTYFSELLKSPFTSYKWEKFENEDS